MSSNKNKIGIFDPDGKKNNPFNDKKYSDDYKVLSKMWSNLPAYKKGKDIVKEIEENDIVLVKSETGSGKSVLVPKFAIHTLGYKGLTVMTLPKKIITQATAEFAAKTLDVEIGEYVGYQYRGERMVSNKTSLLFSTDGSIISMIKKDPLLIDIDILIIDEAHERKIQIDLLLYLVKNAVEIRKKQDLRPLKLIIMSATIDEKLFEKYYSKLKFSYLFLSGETNYPIESTFLDKSIMKIQNGYVDVGIEKINQIIKDIKSKKKVEGDILFFVTSISECMSIAEKLDKKLDDSFVMALYSSYPKELKPYISNPEEYKKLNSKYTRRIFIATNIAESSITIDGIVYVIDSGLEIDVYYDPKTQVNVMKKQLITQAQMRQRKGRAGRSREGFCYHLYTEKEMKETKGYPEPEIKKVDLKNITLSFMQIESVIKEDEATVDEVKDVFKKLIQPPSEELIKDGFNFIEKHGLIENEILTELGKLLIDTRMDIFQSITLLHAYQYGRSMFKKVFLIICIIDKLSNGVKDLFFEDTEPSIIKKYIKKIDYHHSDFILLYQLFLMIADNRDDENYDVKMYDNIKKLYSNNLYKVHSVYRKKNYKYEVKEYSEDYQKIIACFHKGFSSNVAIKKKGKFYFNKLECKFDSYVNVEKLEKVIFYSNILIQGKLKISIISK